MCRYWYDFIHFNLTSYHNHLKVLFPFKKTKKETKQKNCFSCVPSSGYFNLRRSDTDVGTTLLGTCKWMPFNSSFFVSLTSCDFFLCVFWTCFITFVCKWVILLL